jgi:hypothetical protein
MRRNDPLLLCVNLRCTLHSDFPELKGKDRVNGLIIERNRKCMHTVRLVGALPSGDTSSTRTVGEGHAFKPAAKDASD